MEDKKAGNFVRIDSLNYPEGCPLKVWMKGINFPVFLHRQISTNKDGSTCALQARKILRPEMVATVKLRSAAVYQVLRGVR